jgi:hypothetical protein
VVEHLPNKCKALRSNPSTKKKKKGRKNYKKARGWWDCGSISSKCYTQYQCSHLILSILI